MISPWSMRTVSLAAIALGLHMGSSIAVAQQCTAGICECDEFVGGSCVRCTINTDTTLSDECELDWGTQDVTVAPGVTIDAAGVCADPPEDPCLADGDCPGAENTCDKLGYTLIAGNLTVRGTVRAQNAAIFVEASGFVRIIDQGAVRANGDDADGIFIEAGADVTVADRGVLRSEGPDTEVYVLSGGAVVITSDTAPAVSAEGGGAIEIDTGDGSGGITIGRDAILSSRNPAADESAGDITLTAAGPVDVQGTLRANATGAGGVGGTVSIETDPGADINIGGSATIRASGTGGDGIDGDIYIGPACAVTIAGVVQTSAAPNDGRIVMTYRSGLTISGTLSAGASPTYGNFAQCRDVGGVCEAYPVVAGGSVSPPLAGPTLVPLGPCAGCGNLVVEPELGEQCDDGNTSDGDCCTSTCQSPCEDGNVCTTDSCSVSQGCIHTPGAGACDDGDACTQGDACAAGVCVGTQLNCADGVACTVDACSGGQCTHTPSALLCDDGDDCTIDTCSPATGCSSSTDCDDANACTLNDRCTNGVCRGTLSGPCLSVILGVLDPVCGNGTIEPPEQCDDGNTADGDCCSARCQLGSPSASCDDGNPCTTADFCQDGTCVGLPTPAPGCREPRRGVVQLNNRSPDSRDKLTWKWLLGPTTSAEFGDPASGTTSYDLCVYDTTAGTPSVAWHAVIPGGGLCGGRPCWQEAGGNYRFTDKAGVSDGITSVLLRSGAPDNAKIVLKGKGAGLGLPPLPLAQDPAVTVQLRSTDGECWTLQYAAPASRSDTERFKDRFTSAD